MRPSVRGAALLAAAAAMFSIGGVCFRLIPFHPLAANGARCALAAGVSLGFFARDKARPRANLSTLAGGACLALTTNLFALAVRGAGAGAASLLLNTSPLFVLAALWAAGRQKPAPAQLAAALLVLGGVALVVRPQAGGMAGYALGLASGASYAGVFLCAQGPNAHPPSAYLWGQLLGAAAGAPFWAFVRREEVTPAALLAVLLLGLVQLGFSYRLLAKGLALAGPAAASLLCCLEPVLSPVWAALFVGEALTARFALGAALVLGGVAWYRPGGAAQPPGRGKKRAS